MILDGGQVRFQALICGMPGAGKTTLMRALARRAIVEDGATVIAHDPMGEWSREWAGRITTVTARTDGAIGRVGASRAGVPTVDAIIDNARRGRLPRAIAADGDSTVAAGLAESLGTMLNTATKVTRPFFLLFDEAALLSDTGASYQSQEDRRLTAIRRHRGVAIAWNVQAPTMLPIQYWQLATDVYTYTLASRRDVQTLERRCGLDDGVLSCVLTLPRYHVLRIRRGVGVVPLWWSPS